MKKLLAFMALITLPFMVMSQSQPTVAQDGGDAPAAGDETFELFGVVKKIDGPIEEIVVETPDGDVPDIELDAKYPQGTTIYTGDASVILAIEGTFRGREIQNSMMSIRHTSEITLDRLLVEPASESVVTRMKVRTGEVRVKVTDDRADYSTDLKVATPNATASISGTDVQQISYGAKGTIVAVASGSVNADRSNGTNVAVGAGGDVGDDNISALESMATKGEVNVPQGSVAFEVDAGQLVIGGVNRPGSDANNSSTNPTGSPSGGTTGDTLNDQFENGEPLPSTSGRSNKR